MAEKDTSNNERLYLRPEHQLYGSEGDYHGPPGAQGNRTSHSTYPQAPLMTQPHTFPHPHHPHPLLSQSRHPPPYLSVNTGPVPPVHGTVTMPAPSFSTSVHHPGPSTNLQSYSSQPSTHRSLMSQQYPPNPPPFQYHPPYQHTGYLYGPQRPNTYPLPTGPGPPVLLSGQPVNISENNPSFNTSAHHPGPSTNLQPYSSQPSTHRSLMSQYPPNPPPFQSPSLYQHTAPYVPQGPNTYSQSTGSGPPGWLPGQPMNIAGEMAEGDNDEQLARQLHQAVEDGDINRVKDLLGQGANPNHQLYWSEEWRWMLPPLHGACEGGYLEMVKILVNAGAAIDKDVRDKNNKTPLHLACLRGYKEVVQYLVEQVKCDTGVRDDKGWSPLDCALEDVYFDEDSVDIVHYLISCGCGGDKERGRLLCGACYYGNLDMVKELVEQLELDPNNVRDEDTNRSPLHYACERGNKQVVQYLVERAHCDVNVTDDEGITPLDWAIRGSSDTFLDQDERKRCTEVVDYLKSLPTEHSAGQKRVSSGNHERRSHPAKVKTAPQAESAQSQVISKALGTPLSEEDSGALQKLLQRTKVKLPSTQLTLEDVQQWLLERGHKDLATNLRAELDKVIKEQQKHLKQLEDLMSAKDTIDIRYLKTFLVGPPGVGKTTTLNRLLKVMVNIFSAGDRATVSSTLLANCIQVFAFVSGDGVKWISSSDLNEETKLLFCYLCGYKLEEVPQHQSSVDQTQGKLRHIEHKHEQKKIHEFNIAPATRGKITQAIRSPKSNITPAVDVREKVVAHSTRIQCNRIHTFIGRLQKVIMSEDHSILLNLLGSTLLNIHDIGGQPCFLEMLPALSTGPAMYLVFLDLSKDLDKPYKIPFNREDTVITPYDALHTVKSTISQILSAVSSVHCISRETYQPSITKAVKFQEKFECFKKVKPVAALVGTHKDLLKENTEQMLENIDISLKQITSRYSKIVAHPDFNKCFFAVDNLNGTDESDVGPIRDFMGAIFRSHFKDALLPIHSNWLWFSLILRREYRIVSMVDCVDIAQLLGIDREEIDFILWYLHFCTGSLMYYPDIPDDWFKNHIICSPQVVFDSISELVVASLRTLHTEGAFTEYEKKEVIQMGQFSIESIEKYCARYQVKKNLGKVELIPPMQLVKLLDHVNLLSPITHKESDGSERITYFMPAILDCASQEELTTPPLPDKSNPEPLLITFSCGYVPAGTFCGLITRLATLGQNSILGLQWELVEEGVKRNWVSFYIDKLNKVTLIAHEKCYEIRATCKHRKFQLTDSCSYVLSVILYTLKSLYKELVPQIAFNCPCPDHKSSSGLDHLCTLTGAWISEFVCGSNPVDLRKYQQVWLGVAVTLGGKAKLKVLEYAEDEFSFHWTKEGSRGQIKTTSEPNVLTFQSVSKEDLGYYRCEVREAGKVVLTVYRALYKDESTTRTSKKGVTKPKKFQPTKGGKRSRPGHPPEITKGAGQCKELSTKEAGPKGADGTLSLKKLVEEYSISGDQLDCEIEDKDIIILADYFDDAEYYLSSLGLSPAEQADVRSKTTKGNRIAMNHCLLLWKQHNPSTATLRTLLKILLKLKKEEIAFRVCKYYCPTHK